MSRYQRSMRSALQSVADSQMEFDEAVKWEVKIGGLPTFYADGKSKGEVLRSLRKLLKRPKEIVSIERVTSAELKKIRRAQIQGDEPDDEQEVQEQILTEDNRAVKVQNKELSIDDIVNMIQFGKPFEVVDEDIPATLPPGDPNFPRYKDIPNSVVDKEDKKANKVKDKIEKDTLVPTETQEATDTWHPDPEKDRKSTSMKHHVKTLKHQQTSKKKPATFKKVSVTPQQVQDILKKNRERAKARQNEAVKVWTDKAQAKDKKDQNKDPVGPQHEGIVSGAGKVAGAAIGGALGLGVSPALGVATGAGIIKGTDKIQKALDKKKLALKKSKKEEVEIDELTAAQKKKREASRERTHSGHKSYRQAHDADRGQKKPDRNVRKYSEPAPSMRAGPKGKLPEEVEIDEVAPPGWGHTKAEKEKTKPNKPKSKIGGSAHEFDKDLKSGKFKGLPGDKTMKDKRASMFKLMWSMKNKGDKPHYKPGVKNKLKAKYKKDESVLDSASRYLFPNNSD